MQSLPPFNLLLPSTTHYATDSLSKYPNRVEQEGRILPSYRSYQNK